MERLHREGGYAQDWGDSSAWAESPGKRTHTEALMLLRHGDGGVAPGAEAAVERAGSSSGEPLPGELRSRFESSTGADLGNVRVHTGADSAAAAGAVGARAYALGSDIHFNQGQYNPGSSDGQHLIAHEVAHTVQQAGIARRAQFQLEVSSPGDAHEIEADRAAGAMLAGRPASLSSIGGSISRLSRTPNGAGAPQGGDAAASGADSYQPIIDQALSSHEVEGGEKLWHLDSAYGLKLLMAMKAGEMSPANLPKGIAGTERSGNKDGFLDKKVRAVFGKLGVKNPYAVVTYQGVYLLTRAAAHTWTTNAKGDKLGGNYAGIEAFKMPKDLAGRVKAPEKKPAPSASQSPAPPTPSGPKPADSGPAPSSGQKPGDKGASSEKSGDQAPAKGSQAADSSKPKTPNGLQEIIATFGQPNTNLGMFAMRCGPKGKMMTMCANKKLGPVFQDLFNKIFEAGKSEHIHFMAGLYNPKKSGEKWSTHAWGIAIDINPEGNGMVKNYKDGDKVPVSESQKILAPFFEEAGFLWGKAFGDSMHFQFATGY